MPDEHAPTTTLTVVEEHRAVATSAGGDVLLAVDERSLGRAGSRNVASAREALAARGFGDARVLLDDVQHESWAWVPLPLGALAAAAGAALGGAAVAATVALCAVGLSALLGVARASWTTSRMRVRCDALGEVRDALDAASGLRGVSVQGVAWRYDPDDGADLAAEAACLRRARARADALARGAGLRVVALRACDDLSEPRPTEVARRGAVEVPASRGRASFGAALVGVAAGPREVARRMRFVFEAAAAG